jgi:DNA-binding CsgD family transcriptional regulator
VGAAAVTRAHARRRATEPAPPEPAPLADVGAGVEAYRDVARRLDGLLEGEARALHREADRILEHGVLARLAALARVRAAVARLEELGPVSELVEQAPACAAAAAGLERVLLSRVEDGALVAEAVHAADAPVLLERLREHPVALDYPLVEGELLRRRRPLLVPQADAAARARHAYAAVLGPRDHVIAPVVLEGRVAGMLHGDRAGSAPVTALDRDALWTFAQDFARVYERAVLRRRLRAQREEMRQVASWADARTSELSDRAISLAAEEEGARGADRPPAPGSGRLRDLLTRRELDVLELMVRGETNAGIARALVVAEGTVKFHVKNILRKLQAANRAEATSRYLRLTLRDPA